MSQLAGRYLICLPSFIVGGIALNTTSTGAFYIWLAIIGLFFGVIEIRVLCAHCPHYEKSGFFLTCWANYGMPKLWKYRPVPMNNIEKTILLAGFAIVWGFPAVFIFLFNSMGTFALYMALVALFFITLSQKNCTKCVNLSCPLNRVDDTTKTAFLRNNPQILKLWEKDTNEFFR